MPWQEQRNCGIVGFSKIEFFNFSDTETVNRRDNYEPEATWITKQLKMISVALQII